MVAALEEAREKNYSVGPGSSLSVLQNRLIKGIKNREFVNETRQTVIPMNLGLLRSVQKGLLEEGLGRLPLSFLGQFQVGQNLVC